MGRSVFLSLQRTCSTLNLANSPKSGLSHHQCRGEDPWKSSEPWKQRALAVVKKWLGEQRRTGKRGQGVWVEPDPPHAEILVQSPFPRQALYELPFEQSWTISSFIGYLYSTAFCLQIFLGDNVKQFEDDLTETLLAINPSGQFKEEIKVSFLAAWKH